MEGWAALGISIVSVFFAGLAWWQTRDMVAIERARDIKQATASASAKVVPVLVGDINAQGRLVQSTYLRNVGAATAHGVTVTLEPIEGEGKPAPRFAAFAFPCDIAGGAEAKLHVRITLGGPTRAIVVVSWTDGNGSHAERSVFSFI